MLSYLVLGVRETETGGWEVTCPKSNDHLWSLKPTARPTLSSWPGQPLPVLGPQFPHRRHHGLGLLFVVLHAVSGHSFISVSSLGPKPDSRHPSDPGSSPGTHSWRRSISGRGSHHRSEHSQARCPLPAVCTRRGKRKTHAPPPGCRKAGPRGNLAWARGPGSSVAPVAAPVSWTLGAVE